MLRYVTETEFNLYPKLIDTMFKDRAQQFKGRLDWSVTVDTHGYERDQYDHKDALYAIWEMPDGSHGASMRVLSTGRPVMVNDFFSHITGRRFEDPLIWESTRFCISPNALGETHRLSAAIMLSGCELGLNFALKQAVAVFDPGIMRIYKQIGWPPEVLGKNGHGREAIWAGIWNFDELTRRKLCAKAGLSPALSRYWFNRSMGHQIAGGL
ncbi:MAG: acyl-homoserine-lactone synthase [Pseudomonadota bacterium]